MGWPWGGSEELPRAEGIFEENVRWKLEDDGSIPETDRAEMSKAAPRPIQVQSRPLGIVRP